VIFAGSQQIRSAGTAISASVSGGGTEIVSSGGTTSGTLLASGQETVLRGGHATGGFDLGEGHQSLGFASATPWARETSGAAPGASGIDKGGLFNLRR
jgi:autotransporter passenger strand-loop-strand repeat protein